MLQLRLWVALHAEALLPKDLPICLRTKAPISASDLGLANRASSFETTIMITDEQIFDHVAPPTLVRCSSPL